MANSGPLVSVVTPFHNTDSYLAECIESVLAQDYENFEYILVDNQSTDRSLAIAEDYASRDSRIRLVRTSRLLSQVQNYNFTLEQISEHSAHTKMCQADDWLYPRCLTEMVELAEQHANMAMVSSYYLREAEVMCTGMPQKTLLSGRDACRLYFLNGIFPFGTPTTLLYRSSLIRQKKPFYEENRLHEDTELCFDVLLDRDFGFVHQILSFTRLQAGSITGENRDLIPEALDRVIVVKRHGQRYLDADEYRECLERAKDLYYRAMARRWLRGLVRKSRADFWAHQERGLATVGETVDRGRLASQVALVLGESLLSPLDVARAALRARQSS